MRTWSGYDKTVTPLISNNGLIYMLAFKAPSYGGFACAGLTSPEQHGELAYIFFVPTTAGVLEILTPDGTTYLTYDLPARVVGEPALDYESETIYILFDDYTLRAISPSGIFNPVLTEKWVVNLYNYAFDLSDISSAGWFGPVVSCLLYTSDAADE